jgi:hypothetical protein
MNNILRYMLGIQIPSVGEIVKQAKEAEAAGQAEAEQQAYEQQLAAQQTAEHAGPQPIGAIQFVLLEDGTATCKMQWVDESEAGGTVFGEFLHKISSGELKNNTLELLLKIQSQDVRNKTFVEAAVKQWRKLLEEADEEPMVHPLQVFGMSGGPDD